MTLLLTCLFVLSGAAGLIYESIWSRYLGLFVGHSAYAQVIVLVIFLGGMSVGAAIAARHSARVREPLLWYAAIEGVVGVLGLAFHPVFSAATGFAYDSVFPALAGGTLLVVVKWTLAALLILPQSILLGATFPLMSAALLRRAALRAAGGGTIDAAASTASSGRVLGVLYFANSLGAAGGVLLAGFWLIGFAGLPGTLVAAAALNLVVALATYSAVRAEREDDDGDPASNVPAPPPLVVTTAADAALQGAAGDAGTRDLWRVLLAVSFGTAVASFIYEIAWIRMLSLVLGSATHAFELMLSAFILGLALGAFWVRTRADTFRDPVRTLGIVQFAMGALAVATLGVYGYSFEWMSALIEAVDENAADYHLYNLARYGIALGVMLPATFCAGITLPLITRTLLGGGHGERSVGAVYAWNTLGSIVGVSVAALLLMPLVGLRSMLIIGGALDIALGLWLLWRRSAQAPAIRQTATLATAAGIAVVAVSALAPSFDPGILSSGVFRYGTVPERGARNIVFYKDGRTASVSVRLGSDSGYSLATNGKPDASISRYWFDEVPEDSLKQPLEGDESTQVLLPLLTLAHMPGAREAAVIGHGSGLSTHFLLGSEELDRVETIDIEPEMVNAARLFLPANLRAYDDPRSRFVYDDAKSFFAAANRRFDLILSEPSNPWVSGVSGLFTDEFYARVSRYLTPQGVFGQWLHLYEIEDALVLDVLAALHRNFRSYAVYLTNDVDVLVVATNAEQLPAPDWSVFRSTDIAIDLERFVPISDAALSGTLLLTRAELAPLLDTWRGANSDFHPTLDLGAERARFLRHSAYGFLGLRTDRYNLADALDARRVPLSGDRRASMSHRRVDAQLIADALRRDDPYAPTDTVVERRPLQAARFRAQRLAQGMAAGEPPADWFLWFTEVVAAETDRHDGTMGVVDSAWYAGVERFMRAQGAPADGVSALRFLRAAASYDWVTAARESETQLTARDRGRQWLPLAMFCDAAVLARLRVGDVSGARALFVRLCRSTERESGDLRTLLLDAHVAAAESGVAR